MNWQQAFWDEFMLALTIGLAGLVASIAVFLIRRLVKRWMGMDDGSGGQSPQDSHKNQATVWSLGRTSSTRSVTFLGSDGKEHKIEKETLLREGAGFYHEASKDEIRFDGHGFELSAGKGKSTKGSVVKVDSE